MSNATYIANKAAKLDITSAEWKQFYLSKEGYQQVKFEVEAGGLQFAADVLKVSKETIINFLRYNGRGKFVKVGNTPPGHVEKSEEVVELVA
jgi:hypothetical protein